MSNPFPSRRVKRMFQKELDSNAHIQIATAETV
jgi:hypothetical protein